MPWHEDHASETALEHRMAVMAKANGQGPPDGFRPPPPMTEA